MTTKHSSTWVTSPCRSKRGFTLIELSLTLVIIGVIIGAIIVAKTLIVNARLQTILTDADAYSKVVGNFKQAYQGLPGDLANATTLWGADSSGCPSGGGTGTCNGNNDGAVAGVASYEYESFRFWQQLNLAGLVNKSFTGIKASGGVSNARIGGNVPAGSVEGTGFSAIWLGTITSDANKFPGFYGNVFQFGAATALGLTEGPALKPELAASLDTKMDDGLPASGTLRAYLSTSTVTPNCSTTAVAATAAYNVSNGAPLCSLVFVTGF